MTITGTELAVRTPDPLTDEERTKLRGTMCDACGTSLIPAKYKVLLSQNKGSLFLCGHHLNKHEESLLARGAFILQ